MTLMDFISLVCLVIYLKDGAIEEIDLTEECRCWWRLWWHNELTGRWLQQVEGDLREMGL